MTYAADVLAIDPTPLHWVPMYDASVAAGQIADNGDSPNIWDGGVNTVAPALQQAGPFPLETSYSYDFNGSTHYVGLENSFPRASNSQSGTLNIWVKGQSTNGYVFADGTASSLQLVGMQLDGTTERLYFMIRRSGGAANQVQWQGPVGSAPNDGAWHMYTIVADGSNPWCVYLDGIDITATGSFVTAGTGTSADWYGDTSTSTGYFPTIGARRTSATGLTNYSDAMISQLLISDVVFTPAQVLSLYRTGAGVVFSTRIRRRGRRTFAA